MRLGDAVLRIRTRRLDDSWMAFAERAATGDRFGIEITDADENEATRRLTEWLTWQDEHARALAELQDAERAYHRAVSAAAFPGTAEDPSPAELQRESLEAVDAARGHLDEVRGRQPK